MRGSLPRISDIILALLIVVVICFMGVVLVIGTMKSIQLEKQLLRKADAPLAQLHLQNVRLRTFVLNTGYLFLGMLLVLFFYQFLLKPIRALSLKRAEEEIPDVLNSQKELTRELDFSRNALKKWSGEVHRQMEEKTKEVEEVNKELAQTLSRLGKAETMASLGELSVFLAHEIKNPLAIINTTAYNLTRTKLGKNLVNSAQIGIIQRELRRIDRIVRSLLQFSKMSISAKTASHSVNDCVEKALALAEEEKLTAGLKIKKKLEEAPAVFIDPDQIALVFLNIIRNASEAVKISKQAVPAPDSEQSPGVLVVHSHALPGGEVVVDFSDTGCGIPGDKLGEVFEPFFTTKRSSGGVGLGLFICTSVLKMSGGRITAESEAGKGSTFTVHFPAQPVQ